MDLPKESPFSDEWFQDTTNNPPVDVTLVLAGDAGVGKTTLYNRLLGMSLIEDPRPTLGVDIGFKRVHHTQYGNIKLHMYDTGGQERFRALTPMYFRKAHGIIYLFNVAERSTFEHLFKDDKRRNPPIRSWYDTVLANNEMGTNRRYLVVGNQTDRIDTRTVSTEEAKLAAKEHFADYGEVSARYESRDLVEAPFLVFLHKLISQLGESGYIDAERTRIVQETSYGSRRTIRSGSLRIQKTKKSRGANNNDVHTDGECSC